MELDEDSGGSDTMTFPGEDAAMMVYNAPLPQGGVVCLALVLGPRLAIVGDPGTHGYINIYIYITTITKEKNMIDMIGKGPRGRQLARGTSAGSMLLSQTL
jgi:hypothetical protein